MFVCKTLFTLFQLEHSLKSQLLSLQSVQNHKTLTLLSNVSVATQRAWFLRNVYLMLSSKYSPLYFKLNIHKCLHFCAIEHLQLSFARSSHTMCMKYVYPTLLYEYDLNNEHTLKSISFLHLHTVQNKRTLAVSRPTQCVWSESDVFSS